MSLPSGAERPFRRPRVDTLVIVLAALSALSVVGCSPLLPPGNGPSQTVAQAVVGGPTPSTTKTPTPPPTSSFKTVTVSSIPSLLSTLADNSVDVIVVANGTYHVSPASDVKSDSLWIGSPYAGRTRPITVKAQTRGGVTFDGGGASDYGGLSFEDGAHDQTWDGFNFANMAANYSGIIGIAGYTPRRAPHHITLRNITIERTCTGSATSPSAPATDHAIYIANALDPGPHDLLFEDITVDGRGGLASAFHFFHSSDGAPNASDVTVRRLHVTGTQQAIILWDPTLHRITFDSVDITGALSYAIRYETVGSTGILLSNVTSTASGYEGFYSSEGSHPPGVTFSNTSLH